MHRFGTIQAVQHDLESFEIFQCFHWGPCYGDKSYKQYISMVGHAGGVSATARPEASDNLTLGFVCLCGGQTDASFVLVLCEALWRLLGVLSAPGRSGCS